MSKTELWRRGRYGVALVPAVVLIIGALLVDSAAREARRMGFVSDHARVAAATIDLRLGKLLELTGFCASSTALTERVDLNDLKANCGRYAARLDGWVVVIETGTTHRQILNTWSNAPDVLPSYPRTEERSALLALEARSRKTGQPLLAEVFTGMVNRDGIVTAGQAIRLGDGRSAMVYVAIPAAALSEQLAVLAEGGGAVLGLVDPSHRIVARSSGIERYMFADVPSWFRGSVDAGQAGTSLGMPGPVEIGGIWDAGYHPLSVAPGWMAVAVRPAPKGPWPWTVLSVQSGMALVGLGLAICQRILKAMGTQLTVESAPGKGSTFSFRLTLPGLAEAAVETEARALDGVVIVYAEDEPIIRQVTARRLTAAGATVIEAVDGADALDQLATRTPDLLLLDLQMPGLDGVATIRRLRATDAPPSYPIFVLTSHISGPQAAEARAAGADVVFTKPVQILPLAAALRARRGDGGRHTPTIGGGPGEQGPEMVNLDEFLSVAAVSGETFETTLLPKFGTSMQANLSQLRAAIGDGDLAQAGAVAHRSLGTCQVMGALGLSHQLRQIEIAAKAQDTAALTGLQDGLDAMLEATLAQMRQVLRDRPQTTARPDSPS